MKRFLFAAGIFLVIYIGYRVYRYSTLDRDLEAKIAEGAIILDVRTEKEYKSKHIEGAINISLGTLREKYLELDTSKTYITCCSHGLRSVKAKSILKEKGFKHVYNGGAWTDLEAIIAAQKK